MRQGEKILKLVAFAVVVGSAKAAADQLAASVVASGSRHHGLIAPKQVIA